MNYRKIYQSLIKKRKRFQLYKSQEFKGYIETHHIIPRCMGGTDDKENLINLTVREHYIAHLLLWKIYNNNRLLFAITRMKKAERFNSKLYDRIRKFHAKAVSDFLTNKYNGEKNPMFGKHWITNIKTNVDKLIYDEEPIPDGWVKGRFGKGKIIWKQRNQQERHQKFINNILLYTEMYMFYDKFGWDAMVKKYHYQYTLTNFAKLCKKYVKEFIPQKGKKRGK